MASAVDRMKGAYIKEYERNPVLTLFLTILIAFFIVFAVAAAMTGGDTFYHVLNSNRSDVFSDHFGMIMEGIDDPYTKWLAIYPPLVMVFYAVLGHFTTPFVDIPAGDELSAELLRNSQMGIMSFFIIMALAFYVLHLIVSKLMKEEGFRKELVFLFAVLLAYPFVYAFERGNNIIFALVFCFIFILGYRSENRMIRYASYIALGCAAGLKLYPVILLLLILRERNYREAAVCVLFVAAAALIPFIFTDGNPMILLDNIMLYTGANLGVTNINQIIVGIFQEGLGVAHGTVSVISYAAIGVFTLLSVAVILLDREMKFWKVIALLSCNLVLGLGVGVQYQIIYMAMPIFYFLAAEREMTRENKFYTVCFAMMMVLIPGIEIAGLYPSAVIGAMESAFVIVVAIALLREGLGRILRNRSAVRAAAAA